MQTYKGDFLSAEGVVAGSSGDVLWSDGDTLPLWTTVDGLGDDYGHLVHQYSGEHDTHVHTVDGATGRALWTSSVAGWHELWDEVDLDGDGGAELVLVDQQGDYGLTVLGSSDGQVMWRG